MRVFLFILLFCNLFTLKAGHIIGGDIYYDYLGNNNYRFNIDIFLECNSTAGFDSPLNLAVYDANNFLVQNVAVPFPGQVNVPVVFNNPCVTPPGNVCAVTSTYTTIINLPPTVGGYTITYQRCCRNPNITNIINPADVGFTLTCHVPGIGGNNYINSSPRFSNYPPLLLCNNEDLVFDHSATDPDGDQLVYSLITPYSGASGANPLPNPAPPPGYFNIQWMGGFTALNPLGPGATISINPNTGLLLASPNLTGRFVVGIQVEEIRNGVVINKTMRDFVFQVFSCQVALSAILPAQEQLPDFVSYCNGLDVNFVNNSFGGTNYAWDFGVPGTNTDVSNAFAPSYTYPSPGIYEAMLVVNPGWPCTDTAYMEVNVNNEITVSFTSNDSMCIFDNSFDFIAATSGPAGTNFDWNFGPNASQQTANGSAVNNIVFSTTGFIPITLEANFNVCEASFTDSIYIFPEPVAGIGLPSEVECAGLTIPFTSTSQESILFNWDFGVPVIVNDVSTDENPTYTFPGPGTYTINLIAGSSALCADTTSETITLNEQLVVAFTSEDSLCFSTNNFNFDGTVSGPPNSVFTWDFGANASVASSTDTDVNNVVFNTTGEIPITLTGTFENCVESVTQSIYIYTDPTIDFSLAPGNQCAPFEAHFIDQSTAETGITYAWDFGDGNVSNLQNPINTYYNVGPYTVTLVISTAAGCVDTLTLVDPDLVYVRPKPEAGFSVDPDYTDICHSVVSFTDLSFGAETYFYFFDDSTAFSNAINPIHLYFREGSHRPMQIVTSEYGCKDTAYQTLYIEPFTFYAPNSFTPDGDEFNNTFLPIVYLEVSEWKLKILNRWGEEVFESHDLDYGWDGTGPNGKLAQDGTYFWEVTFHSCEPMKPARAINGHVTLMR